MSLCSMLKTTAMMKKVYRPKVPTQYQEISKKIDHDELKKIKFKMINEPNYKPPGHFWAALIRKCK